MPDKPDQTERLIETLENLTDDINGFMQIAEEGTLLKEIVDEVRTLRSAIDDARAEIEWTARNLMQASPPHPRPAPLTSFPADSCDPKFAEKVNAVSWHDLPKDEPQDVPAPAAATTVAEFSTDERVPELPLYCCENPILLWVGDPESPGIYCKSCNFIVAEYGQIVDERKERPNSFRGVPKPTQKTLWNEDDGD